MIFCDEARVDGLVKRIETPTGMTEHYKDREDFLYYKNVVFRKRSKRITMSNTSVVADFRPIDVSSFFVSIKSQEFLIPGYKYVNWYSVLLVVGIIC